TEDSTVMEVNRIEEDSLEFLSFVCHGRSITFDASDYGNNLQWSTGATSQKISVGETGLFTVTAESGCQDLTVNYEVVSASCPYTIELRHLVEPNMVFGCSEATFRYILENDSGEERFGVILLDTLPDGFTFSRIVNNPYESELTEDLPPNVFQLEKLVLAEGIDTIDIVVNVGDLPPGGVQNKAQLKGLSPVLGKIRSSDNPFTLAFPDSTIFFVRGVSNDSLKVDTFLCRDETILLDASFYGESYLWDNGSTESQIPISATGAYQVMIFDGCGTAQVQFNVEQGKEIEVDFLEDAYFIHQGESINLNPDIFNSGDSLHIEWYDERSTNSLSCLNCPQPIATPLSNINYLIYAQNEACRDSAQVEIFVDETRRVYVPSAFSPNNDGINDYFYFQSPDPGTILSFQVFDRWGNLIFKQTNIPFNQETAGWNGTISGITASKGIYLWKAEILFFDEKVERWGGDVTVMD
ncbi:MAG: gliding motility-associated C-terminal domain-containing protein, partial [Bacteroidota bacterium]